MIFTIRLSRRRGHASEICPSAWGRQDFRFLLPRRSSVETTNGVKRRSSRHASSSLFSRSCAAKTLAGSLERLDLSLLSVTQTSMNQSVPWAHNPWINKSPRSSFASIFVKVADKITDHTVDNTIVYNTCIYRRNTNVIPRELYVPKSAINTDPKSVLSGTRHRLCDSILASTIQAGTSQCPP
jgi:hypothetical protein